MKKVLHIKLKRDIRKHLLQYLAVIVIAFLAVTLFCGLTSNYKLLENRVNKLYKESNFADLYLTTTSYDSNDIEYFDNINFVSDYNKRLYLNAKYNTKEINLIFTNDTTISKAKIVEGKPGFLLNANFMKANNLKIGDNIQISVNNIFKNKFNLKKIDGKEDIFNNDVISFNIKITGSMVHPESIENSDFTSGLGLGSYNDLKKLVADLILNNYEINLNDLIKLGNQEFYNQYIFKTNDKDKLKNKLEEYYNNKDNKNLLAALLSDNWPTNITIKSDIVQAKKLTYVFPIIFFVVGILVILTTLSQMIYREKIQIGTLKALGFKNKEILSHYISYGVVLCFIGSFVGFIAGPLFIPNIMGIKYDLLYELPNDHASLFYIENILCMILMTSCGALASYITVHKEIKLNPAQSIRERVPSTLGLKSSKSFDKLPLSLKMAIRNIIRKPIRSLMLVLGLLGCTALLVCGFGIDDTLNYGVNKEIKTIIPFDIKMQYSRNIDDVILDKDYESYEPYLNLPAQIIKNKTFNSSVYFFNKDSKILDFSIKDEGATVTTKVREALSLKIGDSIKIIAQGKSIEVKVVSFVDTCMTQGVFLSNENRFVDIDNNEAFIKLKNDSKENMKKEKNLLLNTNKFDSITTIDEYENRALDLLSTISSMTLTIKVFAISLAIVVIYNLALLNLNERIKEIATLKVLGFSKGEIIIRFLLEIMILCIIGIVCGLLLGYPLVVLVMSINENALIAYLYHVNNLSYVYSILVSFGTSFIVNMFMSKKALNIKMVESLKSVE